MERKLSTVFALDVVGYSKLMADDEARALSNLKTRRDFIDSLIEEFGGRTQLFRVARHRRRRSR